MKHDKKDSSTGAVVGGVVSALIVLVAVGVLGFIYIR